MGKYLKQGFVRHLEWEVGRGNVSHSKMVELIEEECIKNYNQSKIKIERYEQVGELFITPTIKYLYDPKLMGAPLGRHMVLSTFVFLTFK